MGRCPFPTWDLATGGCDTQGGCCHLQSDRGNTKPGAIFLLHPLCQGLSLPPAAVSSLHRPSASAPRSRPRLPTDCRRPWTGPTPLLSGLSCSKGPTGQVSSGFPGTTQPTKAQTLSL